ncbi:growth arrest-specific protein 6-like [Discoglossus pictus]
MKYRGWVSLPLTLFLVTYGYFTDSTPLSDPYLQKQVSCVAVNPVRSSDSLYLGADGQSPLHMEFQLSDLSSNLSSFDFRTFDSDGVIFYGNVGEDSWFVLGIRERRMEVQMSNANGQMVLSKWGPDMSDGKWRKVAVDSSVNTIEVKVDGEVVVKLTHHVYTHLSSHSSSTLSIILGDLPEGSDVKLIRPLQPALDGCMRNWAWVKKDAQVLEEAMQKNENRRCFDREEPGSYFPAHGYAIIKPDLFQSLDNKAWSLSVTVSFRVLKDGGVLLAIYGPGNIIVLTIALDWQKQALVVTIPSNLVSHFSFPVDLCPRQWQSVDVLIRSNKLVVSSAEKSSSWDTDPTDMKILENAWLDPSTQIFVGGIPDHSIKQEPRFSGCLKLALQGTAVDLEKAQYKHPHVRTHSCPLGI